MFPKDIYANRRNQLRTSLKEGIAIILGNEESAMNAVANPYKFRQDSSFLYFFGLDMPHMVGIVDVDTGEDIIFANDVDIDDIIWMGPQPTISELAKKVAVEKTAPYSSLLDYFKKNIQQGRKIHFLTPYRHEHYLFYQEMLGINVSVIKDYVSEELVKAVVALRSVKDRYEIEDMVKAIETGYEMHTLAMKMCKPGIVEREIAGAIEGVALSHDGMVSFPVILSQHGETLHNHYHGNVLEKGRLMLTDAGAETPMHYASDFTRTVPVGGKFSTQQKEIYEIVLKANLKAIDMTAPGVYYRDVHLAACKTIAEGLKEVGLMKGDMDEAVRQGAHALFMPHGLGHMLGLDVHDMENLGEDYVGYDETVLRSDQFGLAYLRLAKKLQPGYVLTDEPGIYFIPELIDLWKGENKFTDFINYDKLEGYRTFGGIRIEDDILVTDTGCEVMGKAIPKTVAEIEAMMQ
jgi:Xaa-Pro aminopeptidase